MHTVLRIDLQALIVAGIITYDFVHPGGAVTLFGRFIEREVNRDRQRGILEPVSYTHLCRP